MTEKSHLKGRQGMVKCAHAGGGVCQQDAAPNSNLCYYHSKLAHGQGSPTDRGHEQGRKPK
jgi:hypothetical protein